MSGSEIVNGSVTVTEESIGLVGLRNTATKNKLTDTVVPLWDLQPTADTVPSAESFNFTNPAAESVIGDDERVKVSPEHFLPGGKYRSIVKLFLRYENQPSSAKWPVATGWLIRPDLLVTAGHCAFDWAHNMGRLVQAKCYIGYNGHESIHDSRAQVQFRQGKKIATTLEWMTAKGNRNFDVAFIQLEQPFTGITPIKFADTLLSGRSTIGIVGYPGDLRDEKTKEPGAQMYEMFLPTNFNLAESQWRMLEYHIDTFGGNSGSPVFRESDLVSIGVHVYGGEPNSASVIGLYGNPFLDYVAAFDMHAEKVSLPGATSTPGVQYITVPTSKTPDVVKGAVDLTKSTYGVFNSQQGFTHEARPFPQQTGFQPSNGVNGQRNGNGNDSGSHYSAGYGRQNGSKSQYRQNGHVSSNTTTFNSSDFQAVEQSKTQTETTHMSAKDEEEFLGFLQDAIKVGGPILNHAFPLALGPLGGPISSLASVAIAAAGRFAESGTESGGLEAAATDGLIEHAILADAAFQAMLRMDNHTLAEEGFFIDVWKYAKKIAPAVKNIAPKVLDVVTQPALQIALQSLGHVQKGDSESFYLVSKGRKSGSASPRRNSNLPPSGDGAFLGRFQAAAANEESLIGDIFGIAKKAVTVVGGPGAGFLVGGGLDILQGALGEASFEEEKVSVISNIEGLEERAVLGEAVLQAAINGPQSFLEEGGFFSSMADIVKNIAPTVLKAAPGILEAVAPIVNNILRPVARTESFAAPPAKGLRPLSLTANGKTNAFGRNKELWSQLQNHHAAGEEFSFSFGPLSVDI
ncbi:ATP synthase F1 [Seiridium cupressi]